MNTAADFLSRTEVNPAEKPEMTIRNDIHTKAIEVNIQSSGIVEEEQIYILPDDELDENQLWQEKKNIRDQAQNETHNEPENNITELQQFHKPTSVLNTCSEGHFRDNAKIRLEQNNDIVLRNLRAKIEGHPCDEHELASDYRYHHYLQNIARIETEVLYRHGNHFPLPDTTSGSTFRGISSGPTWSQVKPSRHYEDDSRSPTKSTITHVWLNTSINGLPTAKFAYKPNELTMIF